MSDKLASGIKAGSASVSLPVELLKAADSTALTGKVYTDVTASYWRQGGVRVAITPVTLGSVNAAWSSGGFLEVDSANMPGVYRFDVPDAAFATGADWVVISLKVATAFQLNFMFALESVGAAELSARIPAALAANGEMKADVLRVNGTAQTARDLGGQLDAAVSTRLATAGYTAPPSAATNATAVRTELGTELGRIDVAVSSRNATTPPTVAAIRAELDANSTKLANLDATISSRNATAPDNAGIAAIKAKTDNLPAAPAAVTDIPSAAAITAAVWAAGTRTLTGFGTLVADIATAVWAAVTRTLTSGAAPSAATIATAVVDQTLSGHSTAGTVGGALVAAGNAGDPWSATNLQDYAADTAGKILSKLNVGAPEDPAIVLPGAPADLSLCRVYGYLETIDNQPAANVEIIFELLAADPTKSERLISGRKVIAKTNADGQLTYGENAYLDLQRNDLLTPSGSKYRVKCPVMNLDKEITLTNDTYDLASIVS